MPELVTSVIATKKGQLGIDMYPESKGYSARNLNYMKQFATLVSSIEDIENRTQL